jgi:hypothetical protein
MRSGSVPPALSELFLPDPSGERAGQPAPSGAEIERFERYLRSVEGSAGPSGAASAADRAVTTETRPGGPASRERHEPTRDRADRRDRSAPSRPDRADHRPAEQRSPADDRADRGVDRDATADRSEAASGRSASDRSATGRADSGRAGRTERDGASEAIGNSDETADGADTGSGDPAAIDEAGNATPVDGRAGVPLDPTVPAGPTGADAPDAGVGAIDGPSGGAPVGPDGQAATAADGDPAHGVGDGGEGGSGAVGSTVPTADQERAGEPVAAQSVPPTPSPGDGTDSSTVASTEDDAGRVGAVGSADSATTAGPARGADGARLADGSGAAVPPDRSQAMAAAAAGAGERPGGADDAVDATVDGSVDESVDGAIDGAVDGGPTATDGPDAAPVLAQSAARAAGSATSTGNPGSGVEAIAGPIGNGNRQGATTTTAANGADGPVFDGDPADPLWLQVRRAMGSLRTLQNGEQQLTIRLRPAELGSVVVRVNAGEHGTRVSLLTDSAVAATQLGQQRQQLISELEQGGLAGVAVDIANGGSAGGPEGQTPGGEDRSSGDGPEGAGAAAALAGATTATVARGQGGRGRRPAGSSGALVDVDL